MTEHIHIIEDDPDILNLVSYNLKAEGFSVSASRDGAEGLKAVQDNPPHLIVLDLKLPSMDGFEICQKVKEDDRLRHVPILIISVRGEEPDIVHGLRLGADDYVSKPFKIGELLARVKAVRRRYRETLPGVEHKVIRVHGLNIDIDRFEAKLGEKLMDTTPTEFRILQTLAANPGRVYTRELLKDAAVADNALVMDHNIDVHVGSIRKKLGDKKELIETVWGVGYRFKE